LAQIPDGIRHRRRFNEEIVRLVRQCLAATRQIHHTINHNVSHMDFFRPELAGH